MIVRVEDLKKDYTTYERGNTFGEVIRSIFVRRWIIVNALKGISFNMEEGELIGFLGPNGAGKSTTLKILSGVLYPTSGKVDILGFTPWKERTKYVAGIGAVFGQKSQLLWDIPPLDAFYMNKAIYSIPDRKFSETLGQLTDLLEVGGIVRKPTRQLSLGERMKCEFIMAMLHRPKIVFLDEPTIGLDVIAKEKIRDFIMEMNKQGVTFVLTTHDLGDVEKLARRVIVVNHGEIAFDSALDALKKHLGPYKLIKVSTDGPLPDLKLEGININSMLSPGDAEIELDTGKLPLNAFIRLLNESSVIRDLSIQEPPIERVIKALYFRDN